MAININKPIPPDPSKDVGNYKDLSIYMFIVFIVFAICFIFFWVHDYGCHQEYKIKRVRCDGEVV